MLTRIKPRMRLFMFTLFAAIGLSLALNASPAAADGADFTSDATLDCVPSYDPVGAVFELRWGDVNPDGVTVLTRTFNGNDLGTANGNGSVTIDRAAALAGGNYRYTWELRDANGGMIANGNGGEFVQASDCTPEEEREPEVRVWIECAPVNGQAQFTLNTEIVSANGNENISFDPPAGVIGQNGPITVTVSWDSIHWNHRSMTVTAAATDDCTPEEQTPEFAASIQCAVVDDAAEFTLNVETVNANGATDIVFSPADGTVVSNADLVVNVSWTSNTGQGRTDTINVSATDDCTPTQELTPEFAAHIECAVVNDAAEFTLNTEIVNLNGATNVVFDPADGTTVANEAQTVNVTWTSNTGQERSTTLNVSATDDCTPSDDPDPEFSAHLVCVDLGGGQDEYQVRTNIVAANGATNVAFDPADGTVVPNEDTNVTVSYMLDGSSETTTVVAKKLPGDGCAIPDGDVAEFIASGGGDTWQGKLGFGALIALFVGGAGYAMYTGLLALRRRSFAVVNTRG